MHVSADNVVKVGGGQKIQKDEGVAHEPTKYTAPEGKDFPVPLAFERQHLLHLLSQYWISMIPKSIRLGG